VSGNLHLAWCRLLARSLALAGVSDVVISPGSRSTPLVLGFDAEGAIRKHTIVDERSAAFFALGMARAGAPLVALLCTSGTAGAHYLPALIEAARAHVPLLVITADRPWDAYDCGASQTIDQVKLFGGHVRHHAELGLPERDALPAVPRIAAQCALAALHPTPGPVHLNARFRKPLEPVDAPRPEPHEQDVERLLAAGIPAAFPPEPQPSTAGIRRLAALCSGARRGLLVAGPAPWSQLHLRAEIVELAALLGYPLCIEATSQLRHGAPSALDVPSFDLILKSRPFLERHRPELILEVGMPPVSGSYGAWLASRPGVPRAVVAPHGWNDPHNDASLLLLSSPDAALRALRGALASSRLPLAPDTAWVGAWAQAQRAVDDEVITGLRSPGLTEVAVARAVAAHTPAGATLLVGNSGPVRDLDLYGTSLQKEVRVIHQRGAAGIDGWVAAAAGARAARGGPVVLFLGDVALLHDVGSLQLAAGDDPLVIVVVNNDGGRIFEQLPLARRPEVSGAFSRHFITPHGLSFDASAGAWGLRYRRVTAPAALDEAVASAVRGPGPTLVEAVVDPAESLRRRASLWGALGPRLEKIS
jgi:2-succinyl-5-enolpyruvyl-6-hydroxy-3-cyclohexene-1-carboxylate synthase